MSKDPMFLRTLDDDFINAAFVNRVVTRQVPGGVKRAVAYTADDDRVELARPLAADLNLDAEIVPAAPGTIALVCSGDENEVFSRDAMVIAWRVLRSGGVSPVLLDDGLRADDEFVFVPDADGLYRECPANQTMGEALGDRSHILRVMPEWFKGAKS